MAQPTPPERLTKKQKQEHARELARLAREQDRTRKRRRRWMTQAGIGVGLLAIVAVVALVFVNSTPPSVAGPLNMLSDGILIEGNGTAAAAVSTKAIQPSATPVATDTSSMAETANIVLYVDYQCPYCKQFETTNGDQIQQWVTSGVATVEIHPIAILDNSSQGTKYSTRAANAAACVANFDPDNYLAVNKSLFANQPAENTPGLTDKEIIKLVQGAGSTGDDVSACITKQTFASWAGASTARALAGPLPNSDVSTVAGTPTVVVNGTHYTGALDDATAFSDFVGQAVLGSSAG